MKLPAQPKRSGLPQPRRHRRLAPGGVGRIAAHHVLGGGGTGIRRLPRPRDQPVPDAATSAGPEGGGGGFIHGRGNDGRGHEEIGGEKRPVAFPRVNANLSTKEAAGVSSSLIAERSETDPPEPGGRGRATPLQKSAHAGARLVRARLGRHDIFIQFLRAEVLVSQSWSASIRSVFGPWGVNVGQSQPPSECSFHA